MLADKMSGMSNLNIFFITIWQELERIQQDLQNPGDLMKYSQELENEEFLLIKVKRSDYLIFINKELTKYLKNLVKNITDNIIKDIKTPKNFASYSSREIDHKRYRC